MNETTFSGTVLSSIGPLGIWLTVGIIERSKRIVPTRRSSPNKTRENTFYTLSSRMMGETAEEGYVLQPWENIDSYEVLTHARAALTKDLLMWYGIFDPDEAIRKKLGSGPFSSHILAEEYWAKKLLRERLGAENEDTASWISAIDHIEGRIKEIFGPDLVGLDAEGQKHVHWASDAFWSGPCCA